MEKQGREHESRISPKGHAVAVKKPQTIKQNKPKSSAKLKRNRSTLKCKQTSKTPHTSTHSKSPLSKQTNKQKPHQQNKYVGFFSVLYPIPDCLNDGSRIASKIIFTRCNFIQSTVQVKTALVLAVKVVCKGLGVARKAFVFANCSIPF